MFALIQIKYQNWPGHEMVILSIAFYFKDYFPHTSNKSNILVFLGVCCIRWHEKNMWFNCLPWEYSLKSNYPISNLYHFPSFKSSKSEVMQVKKLQRLLMKCFIFLNWWIYQNIKLQMELNLNEFDLIEWKKIINTQICHILKELIWGRVIYFQL